ncbi:uncharacterized protein LOC124629628 [Helicoverpa zea]|uniref:uncharacterized protein LOC124629628 n=1 Tax=Helicoverpa zea TaxID=7113 RepID=UPI001F58D7C9|nr:uncharacterized protein LOC124629628 [Helicoverpa zea]
MGITSEILLHFPEEGRHLTGKYLNGVVRFQLDKETVFKKISLSLVKRGFCEWYDTTNTDSNDSHETDNTLQGHENAVLMKLYFLNKEVDDNLTLSAGSYEYPFEMEIPQNIPPSFRSEIGKITYLLILKFKKPGLLKRTKSFQTEVQILPQVDLSITDAPIAFALDKNLTKMFASHNKEIRIIGDLEKPYLSYYDENKLSLAATNNTDLNFTIKTELMSKVTYTHDHSMGMYGDEKVVKEVIGPIYESPVVPDNSVSNIIKDILPVDSQQYTVRHSAIISREYKLKVTIQMPMPHRNVSVNIPVFVGDRRLTKANNENRNNEAAEEPPTYWHAMSEDK